MRAWKINCLTPSIYKCQKIFLKFGIALSLEYDVHMLLNNFWTGIDHISVDGEKGIVTVIGDVDPVLVTSQVRKTGKIVQIISVSPHKPPEKKPSDEKKK